MSARRLSFLFFAGALASGCTSLISQGEQSPLNTQEVTVAAGDEGLKKAVETGENRDAARDEPLDEAGQSLEWPRTAAFSAFLGANHAASPFCLRLATARTRLLHRGYAQKHCVELS